MTPIKSPNDHEASRIPRYFSIIPRGTLALFPNVYLISTLSAEIAGRKGRRPVSLPQFHEHSYRHKAQLAHSLATILSSHPPSLISQAPLGPIRAVLHRVPNPAQRLQHTPPLDQQAGEATLTASSTNLP